MTKISSNFILLFFHAIIVNGNIWFLRRDEEVYRKSVLICILVMVAAVSILYQDAETKQKKTRNG